MAKTPVLDLDDLTELPSVRINGTDHPLRSFGMLAPMELHRLQRAFARYEEVTSKASGELTAAEEKELSDLPDSMCRTVLMAPDDVHRALDDWRRMRILNAFFDLPLRAGARGLGAAADVPTTTPTTGESSSRASSASMEATH